MVGYNGDWDNGDNGDNGDWDNGDNGDNGDWESDRQLVC